MLTKKEVKEMVDKSYKNRFTLLEILKRCGVVHIGGASSAMDILTVLYEKVLRHNPKNPKWEQRDIFLLSAGHKAVAYYVVLQSQGYFEKEMLWTYNTLHTSLPTHPDEKLLPGIEFPTGSLGHGLSVGGGIAIAFKKDRLDRKVYVLLGDGEMAEGAVWEAMLSAVKYKLDNLVIVIDVNELQGEGYTRDILPIAPFENKFISFGWAVRTIDGHNIAQIYKALIESPYETDKPTCIVANTIKAKGIDFAEGSPQYHYWRPSDEASINKAIECMKACHKREVDKVGH